MGDNISISVGDAVLKVGVDTKGMEKGLKGLGASIKKHQRAIGIGMAAMGGAILAAGALSIKTFAKMGDEVQKMALRTGFTTEALSELRHAAELSGTSLSSLEKASKTLSGAILDAGFGLETYVRAFDKIGLSYEELKGLSPEDQFLAVMEALASLTDESEKAALAADIFGRAGTQLLPMLADGAEGLAKMRQEAHDLGIVFDQEAANKAAEFTDALTRLKESISGVQMAIASELIPIIEPLINKVKETVSGMTAWTKENPELSKTLILVTGAVGGLLVGLGGLVLILPTLLKMLAMLKVAFLALMTPIGGLIAGLALVAIGITALISRQKEYDRIREESLKVQEEWQKALAGEANQYLELAMANIKARAAMGALTEAELAWKEAIVAAIEEQEKQLATTNSQTTAMDKLRAATKRYYASLPKAKAISATFRSPEQRARFAAEAAEWEAKATEHAAAGELNAAAFAAQQAASMQTRLQQFGHGGLIEEPTLLTSMRTMKPYAVAGEAGPERISPMGTEQMMTIIQELDGKRISKTIMPYVVGEIRLRTGAQY